MLSLNDIFKLENASKEVESLKCTCEELKLKWYSARNYCCCVFEEEQGG